MTKKITAIICVFILFLTAFCFAGEYIGTSKKYEFNNQYSNAENLALKDTKSKMTDGNINTSDRLFKRKGNFDIIDLGEICEFNSIVLREKGLNIHKFSISVSDDNKNYTDIYSNDKVEYCRLCSFDTVSARYVKLSVDDCDNLPKIREVEIYNMKPEKKDDFRVSSYSTLGGTIYQVIDDETMTDEEKDKKIKEMIDADYYDTVTDYIQIGTVRWTEEGNIIISGWDNKVYDEDKYYSVMMKNLHEVLDPKGTNLVLTILNPSGEGGNEKVVNSITENRDTLITNMIAFCNKYEFDGIDLDWEFPMSQDEFDAYNSFLQELKARMKAEMWNKDDSTLSLALATWALKYTPETIKCIDYVNVMGYDILDQDGEHSSFFSSCVQAAAYIESQGFSKEQINIGFPFYGTWLGGQMEQYSYNKISEKISPFNNYYTMKKADTQEDRTIYFNGQSIIRDKTAYSYINGYGGVMIFSQYSDLPSKDENSLTKAIRDYLSEVE